MKQYQAAAAGASLLDLPDDILVHTLQLVGFASAWAARRACRRLRDAVERGVRAGELRAAADDPAALELLAALVRAGRVRADAVSIRLKQIPRPALEGAMLRLFRGAAAVMEACSTAALAGAEESFEASLTVEDKLMTADVLQEALRDSPALGRLTGLRLPVSVPLHQGAARSIAAKCRRLRRLSFGVVAYASSSAQFQYLSGVLGSVSGLPLEELAVGAGSGRRFEGRSAAILAPSPAARSLRSLQLGEKLEVSPEAVEAIFSLPRLERLSSELAVSSDGELALVEGLLQHRSLREASLRLTRPAPATGPRLAAALRASSLAALHLALDPPFSEGALVALLDGAGAAVRSLRVSAGGALSLPELAALAACGPRLEALCLCQRIEEEVPAAYALLAPLGPRLEMRLVSGLSTRSSLVTKQLQGRALASARRLLPAARLHLHPSAL